MKKITQKIIAGLVSLAMILGSFAGMGLEVKASGVEGYPTTLKVKVVDGDGNPISGVQLCLAYENKNYPNQNMQLDFSEATKEESGEVTYSCEELTDFEADAPYYMLQSIKDESGVSKYEFNESVQFTLAYDYTEDFVYINTIKIGEGDEKSYTGETVILTVKGNEEPDIPVITRPSALNVKVRDQNKKPVTDIQLYMKSTKYGTDADIALKAVDAEGKAEYQCDNTEKTDDTYVLQPAADNKYTCEEPIEVTFGDDGGKTYIATAGGAEYDGREITLSVNGAEEPNPPAEEYRTELKVKVQNADKTGVPGVALRLNTDSFYGKHEVDFKELTGENGEVSLSCEDLDDLDATAPPYVLESADGTYEFEEAVKVTLGYDDEELLAYVKSVEVDGVPFTGDMITLTVKGSKVPDTPSSDQPMTLKVKAKDEKGAVSGVQLYLKSSVQGKDKTFKAATRADGTAEYQCDNTESTDGVFELLPAKNSGYESVSAVKVTFKSNDNKTYIESVGDKAYKGGEILLQLKKKDAGQTVVPPVTEVVKVTKIKITGVSKKIAAGKKIQLTVSVSPSNASNKAVTWTTSNKKYATVDSKGKVSVKKAGAGRTVTVTAAAADGSGVKAAYKIQIKKDTIKSIKLKAKKTVKAGKSLKVKATVKTTGKKANKTIKWTSSNTKYATVSSKGVVKAKKAGKGRKVKITASATDGSGKKKSVTIKIK